jgi:hypothetical protein
MPNHTLKSSITFVPGQWIGVLTKQHSAVRSFHPRSKRQFWLRLQLEIWQWPGEDFIKPFFPFQCTLFDKLERLSRHHDTRHNDSQDNVIQQNDAHHKGLIYDTQYTRQSAWMKEHNNTLPLCWVSLCWASLFICCYGQFCGTVFNCFQLAFPTNSIPG